MAKLTTAVGVLLVVIGVLGCVVLGAKLHPVWIGVALVVCGMLANTEDTKRRMLWMHLAVTLGLIGFLIPAVRSVLTVVKAHKHAVAIAAPGLFYESVLVAVVCLVYVALCVRSFIAARRMRTA